MNIMRDCSLDASGSGQGLVVGFCEQCIEHCGFRKMESVSVSVELLRLMKKLLFRGVT